MTDVDGARGSAGRERASETLDRLLEPGAGRSLMVDAVLGGLVSVVLSVVPLSPILGGAFAGYLHRDDSVLAGATSGLVAALPSFGILVFVAAMVPFVGDPPSGGVIVVAVVLVLLVLFAAFSVTLGAIGGIAGQWFAEEYPEPPW